MLKDITLVDAEMLNKLKGLLIDDVEVPVLYLNPEPEFQPEVKPAIIVFRIGIYPDNTRWTNDKFFDNPVLDDGGTLKTVDMREAPIPYLMYYGIRLYYDYNEDGAILNNFLLSKLPRGAYLSIDGDKYDTEFVSYRNPSATYREFGVVKGNQPREFVDQYLYKVRIELDSAQRKSVLVNTKGVEFRIKPQ